MLEVCTWVTQQTHPSHLDKMVYSIDKNAAEREREKKTDEWETRSMGRTKTEEKKIDKRKSHGLTNSFLSLSAYQWQINMCFLFLYRFVYTAAGRY